MLATIFYFSTIFIIFIECGWVLHPIDKTDDAKKFFKLSAENKDKKWDDYSDQYKSELKSKIGLLYVFVWFIIGLFTVQWVGFLAILLFNLLIIAPISKLLKFSFAYTILHWFNSFIGLAFAIFTIINHFHLRIDLFQYFNSFLAK